MFLQKIVARFSLLSIILAYKSSLMGRLNSPFKQYWNVFNVIDLHFFLSGIVTLISSYWAFPDEFCTQGFTWLFPIYETIQPFIILKFQRPKVTF